MTDDIIARLRAELAKERERADAHYRVLECVSSKRDELRAELAAYQKAFAFANDDRDSLNNDCERLTIERDTLRAELAAAHKFNGMQGRENEELQEALDKARAERDALRALLKEALDYIDDPYNDLAISIGAALNKGGGDE